MTRFFGFLLIPFALLPMALSGQVFQDKSAVLQKQIRETKGNLVLPAGEYHLSRTLDFDLSKLAASSIRCEGAVTLVMHGAGPAIRMTGTHEGTAGPDTFKPETWKERMPLIDGLEIVGAHPEADGIELIKTMQATITRVAVRKARHGIRLYERNRNVVIANCHLYENSGVGLYLDRVNLHQINVTGSHISYNRQGGVVLRDCVVRNLQITGCDIEGNMPGDATPTRAANVWIDLSAQEEGTSVAEVSITGCTLQHSANQGRRAVLAPGGANIRIVGRPEYPVDTVTIGNNVLSDTSLSVDIDYAKDVVLTGNNFFTSMPQDLVVHRSERVLVNGNSFNPRQDWSVGGIVFRDSKSCLFSNNTVHGFRDPVAAILFERCINSRISNCILTDIDHGIVMRDCQDCSVDNTHVDPPNQGGEKIDISAASPPKPLFRDPNYHGSCDPEIVWNAHEQEWWIFYTARRATRETATYVGTPIGVVSSKDLANWRFLGYVSFDGMEGKPDMPVTFWAPGIINEGDYYHMFVTYKDSAEPPWGGKGVIRHYRAPAKDLLKGWTLVDVPSFTQPDPIDATLIKIGDQYRVYYRVAEGGGIHWATTRDLSTWQNQGRCPGDINLAPDKGGFAYQEAPFVFHWRDKYWLLTDPHEGLAVYESSDGVTWKLQGQILLEPGNGPQDNTRARHPSVAVMGDRAFIFYHVEPNRPYPTPPAEQRTPHEKISFLQMAEFTVEDGKLSCDRDAVIQLPAL
ncbi:MAG: right-handed parallel beta-helix repeat-containing protein [Verrucomicrobiae bacterium]|nr:right-handed parallel beta-helix repeat-containing protein [Verrucomicrobiae bacterium]